MLWCMALEFRCSYHTQDIFFTNVSSDMTVFCREYSHKYVDCRYLHTHYILVRSLYLKHIIFQQENCFRKNNIAAFTSPYWNSCHKCHCWGESLPLHQGTDEPPSPHSYYCQINNRQVIVSPPPFHRQSSL